MDIESVRNYCLSFPHVTENIQWDNDLVFKVGGKMFAIAALELVRVSFGCTPEKFAELIERNSIRPAAYAARFHWVSVERFDALNDSEFKELLKGSYERALAKLSKKVRASL